MERKMKTKLDIKDFINIGIFMALSLVIGVIIAIFLGTNPITFLLIGAVGAFVNAIPMMVFFAKIRKKNVFLIYTVVYAIVSLFMGMGYFPAIGTLVFGIAAEFLLRSGHFVSRKKAILAYAVYSLGSVATYIPLYFTTEAFVESRRETYGDAFADGLAGCSQLWIFAVLLALAFVCGLLGALVGSKVFKKHFEKSGMV